MRIHVLQYRDVYARTGSLVAARYSLVRSRLRLITSWNSLISTGQCLVTTRDGLVAAWYCLITHYVEVSAHPCVDCAVVLVVSCNGERVGVVLVRLNRS